MFKKAKKLIAAAAAVMICAAVFANFTGGTWELTASAATADEELYFDWSTVEDSSDIPDWTGKQLKLVSWSSHGTGQVERKKPTQDVVTPEVERVTGVTIDPDKSFDNNGETSEVVLAKMIASNSLPHMASAPDRNTVKKLAEAGLIYEITDELLEQYAPNILAMYPKDKLPGMYDNTWVSGGQSGKMFALPNAVQPKWMLDIDPTIDAEKFSIYATPQDPSPYIWVRDDILKQLYPDAKTRDELEALYAQNGEFTEEDILDVPINSTEDFIQFLYDIQALNVTEGDKKVYPTYINDGSGDHWALLCYLGGAFGWNPGMPSADNNYYTYWNKKDQMVDYMYNNAVYKDALLQLNRMVRDNVCAQESLIDNTQVWNTKLNNGLYAVTYAWHTPDDNVLKEAGKPYRYRKVYLNIPVNDEEFSFTKGAVDDGMGLVVIFKDKVAEEDLPQVIRYFDYFATEAGLKAVTWGPRDAGLFEEEDGVRTLIDKDLENCLVYGEDNGKALYYGLLSQNPWSESTHQWPGQPYYPNKYAPTVVYDKEIVASDAMSKFTLGFVQPFAQVPGKGANFWEFATDVPEIEKFSKAKMENEKAISKIFTARSDEEFETFYKAYTDTAIQLGLSPEVQPIIDNLYKEQINAADMKYLE